MSLSLPWDCIPEPEIEDLLEIKHSGDKKQNWGSGRSPVQPPHFGMRTLRLSEGKSFPQVLPLLLSDSRASGSSGPPPPANPGAVPMEGLSPRPAPSHRCPGRPGHRAGEGSGLWALRSPSGSRTSRVTGHSLGPAAHCVTHTRPSCHRLRSSEIKMPHFFHASPTVWLSGTSDTLVEVVAAGEWFRVGPGCQYRAWMVWMVWREPGAGSRGPWGWARLCTSPLGLCSDSERFLLRQQGLGGFPPPATCQALRCVLGAHGEEEKRGPCPGSRTLGVGAG